MSTSPKSGSRKAKSGKAESHKAGSPNAGAHARQYKIHPAIGIARVGNGHPDQFFIGPEIPGLPTSAPAPG